MFVAECGVFSDREEVLAAAVGEQRGLEYEMTRLALHWGGFEFCMVRMMWNLVNQ